MSISWEDGVAKPAAFVSKGRTTAYVSGKEDQAVVLTWDLNFISIETEGLAGEAGQPYRNLQRAHLALAK